VRRRDLLAGTAGIAAGCIGGERPAPSEPVAPDPAAPRPRPNGRKPKNVLVVLTDDQRFDSFGFMGHPFLTTPHLDRLAASGAVMDQCFVTTSLCCPSRATMLTGRYAHDHGVIDNQSELAASWPTFGTVAQQAGVQTAYIGKWHMGGHTPAPRPGWTTWMSFRGQGRYTYPGGKKVPPLDRGWDVNGTFEELDGYLPDLLTDRAVDWLRAVDTTSDPFLLVVAHKACHAPFTPAARHASAFEGAEVPEPLPDTDTAYEGLPEWLRRQRDTLFGVDNPYKRWPDFRSWYLDYHRTLLAVDESVGKLMATLEDRGLLDDTAVIFLSDNGFMHGEKGSLDKRTGYDTSIRIPWLMRVPGGPEGKRLQQLVLNLDVAATVLDLLGLEPADTMHGRSVLPLVLGEPTQAWRSAFLYEYFFEKSFPMTPAMLAVRTDREKLVTYPQSDAGDELFDLDTDPAEAHNLAEEQPARRKALHRRLRQLQESSGLLAQPAFGEAQRDPSLAPLRRGDGEAYEGLEEAE
jgi:N-acetylglucosamine-6-sulfatase